jgi:uncharacterized surface protein with fasciclin (FAS1) repeats
MMRDYYTQVALKKISIYGLLLVGIVLFLSACGAVDSAGQPEDVVVVPTEAPPAATIAEQLAADGDFALFFSGIQAAGLAGNLQDGGPFTLFAPDNAFFGRAQLAPTLFDPEGLEQIMRHHLIGRQLTEEELAAAGNVETLAGAALAVTTGGKSWMVDYASIVGEPIQASNGVIYPIDALLLPPEIGAEGAEKSIWGVLLEDDRFQALVDRMGGTDAMYQLRFSEEPDAFLAPTNEAFESMPDSLESLLAELEGEGDPHYNDLFAYHIMSPNGWPLEEPLAAADIETLDVIQTGILRGNFGVPFEVEVTAEGDSIQINEGLLLETDIPAANGMVHVIDTVLIPPTLIETE